MTLKIKRCSTPSSSMTRTDNGMGRERGGWERRGVITNTGPLCLVRTGEQRKGSEQ